MVTTTYSFNTPTPGTEEDTWGALSNANWDDVDDLFDGTTQIVSARMKRVAMPADALDPDTGNFQTRTFTANTTLTDSLADGDWLVLHYVAGASFTITHPTITWIGGEPAFTAADVIAYWKINTTLFGNYIGSYA